MQKMVPLENITRRFYGEYSTDDIYRAWTFALVKEKNYSEALNVIERAVDFSPACESHLEELIFKLQYKVPEELSRLLSSHRLDGFGAVLDLGCGTGLMGNYLSSHCSRLEGIDLAQEMLEVARKKGCYDALHCTGITDYFSGIRFSGANTRFDVIAASDVFVYVGDLIDIFKDAFDTLDPGGTICVFG